VALTTRKAKWLIGYSPNFYESNGNSNVNRSSAVDVSARPAVGPDCRRAFARPIGWTLASTTLWGFPVIGRKKMVRWSPNPKVPRLLNDPYGGGARSERERGGLGRGA